MKRISVHEMISGVPIGKSAVLQFPTILFVLVAIISMAVTGQAFAREKVIEKTFSGIESIKMKVVLSRCEVVRSSDGLVHMTFSHDYDPDEIDVDFRERNGRLTIEEDLDCDNCGRGRSLWVLELPDGIKFRFKGATGGVDIRSLDIDFSADTGTGSYLIEDCGGSFDLNTGTGDIELKNSTGEFEFNTGTGKIEIFGCSGEYDTNTGTGRVRIEDSKFDGPGEFNSGTGRVTVILTYGTEYDIDASCGTGNATVDLDGNEPFGYFEFEAQERRGRISSPFEFDGEEEFERNDTWYVRKYFQRGSDDVIIRIITGTGRASLKK